MTFIASCGPVLREDSIGMPFVHILGGLGGHMSCSTFVTFFRQKIYPSAYQITTFLFSKSGQNLKTVKCVSNFTKWFVMTINACDHLDSCIWGWQGGQLTQKNAEFGQNRPFSEVQGQSNDPPDNPKSYRYIYNIKNIYCIYIIYILY